jgi:predicted phage terminase large subunit-like protein
MDWHRRRLNGTPIERRRGKALAVAAPRGHAKSTFVSLILPIHDLVYQSERYIVLVSATLAQAKQRLRNIRRELLTNQHLHSVYGDLTAHRREWTTRRLIVGDCVVEVFSAGTEIRGISHGPWRPTKIILDDAEDSEAVENPERREALRTWFNEVIENLGNGYTHTQVIGTVLHPDSLLRTLLQRPDFEAMLFRSVEAWAGDEALWEKWRRLLTDLHDPEREQTAQTFLEQNRDAMLAGAEVLWPEKESYETLQQQLVTRGRAAFFQEKQNEPLSAETQVFDLERLARFDLAHGEIRSERGETRELGDLTLALYLDPALGRPGPRGKLRGDDAAIVVAGRDEVGHLFVLDAWLRRATPAQQAKQLVALAQRWSCRRAGVEVNGFQELLCDLIGRERQSRALDLAVEAVKHSENKTARISRLEPEVANGWIRFRRDLSPDFFQQLAQFPRGAHDDGPDALEGAVSMLERGVALRGKRTGERSSLSKLKAF